MGIFRFVSLTVPGLLVVVLCLHYLIFQPRRAKPAAGAPTIRRLSRLDVLVHVVTILSLLVLAGTGLPGPMGLGKVMHGWLLIVHCTAGSLFALCLLYSALRWAEACCFEDHDCKWARGLGGYLLGKESLPAGRFDCGQKVLFWVTTALGLAVLVTAALPFLKWFSTDTMSLFLRLHRYSGLLLVLAALVHVYLAAVAKPGGWRLLCVGTVSEEWAKCYHSLWRQETNNGETKQ